jgi:hypothetical protein
MISNEQIKELVLKAKKKGYITGFKHMFDLIRRIKSLDNDGFELLKQALDKAKFKK